MPVYIIIDNLKNYPPIRQTNTHTGQILINIIFGFLDIQASNLSLFLSFLSADGKCNFWNCSLNTRDFSVVPLRVFCDFLLYLRLGPEADCVHP